MVERGLADVISPYVMKGKIIIDDEECQQDRKPG
jgi:hypothetical protein